jgi:hypothetical protein
MDPAQLAQLAEEIRAFVVDAVNASPSGGHLGSNLGAVELTLAFHRSFHSPHDVILWDTGHQAYVHKLLTGRREVQHPPPGRRHVGIPQPCRVRTRLDRELPRVNRAVLCPRHGHRARAERRPQAPRRRRRSATGR